MIAGAVLVASGASCTSSQREGAKNPGGGPRIKVDGEIFDFGFLPQKCVVSHVFWLVNTGGQALEIKKLHPNCGCTEAPLETHEAAPGDSIRAEIAFGSGIFQGPVRKFIQVESNALGRVPALTFTAVVLSDTEKSGPVVVKPRAIILDNLRPDSSADGWTTYVSVQNDSRHPLMIASISRPDRRVACDDFAGPLAPGEERKVRLQFERDLPKQVFSKSITFEVTGNDTIHVTIPIFKTRPWGDTLAVNASTPR